MTSLAEITTRYARALKAADRRMKGRILDKVVSVTGWSRDDSRRRLTSAAQSPPGAGRSVATRPGKQRPGKQRPGKQRAGKQRAGKQRAGKQRAGKQRAGKILL